MKNQWFIAMGAILCVCALSACGTAQTAAEKEKQAIEIVRAVEEPHFTFQATYAHPTGYKSIYLSPFYDVKVSSDTVEVYLPYYGRAYRAPMNPSEGGYRFTSTDFTYKVMAGKKKANWLAEIVFHDTDRPITFHFDLWENGTARLNVSDVDKQQISFQGNLLLEKKDKAND